MAAPSLSDKKSFFSAVLNDGDFQKNGIVFGEQDEPRHCKWVVVDPNRHVLRVWEKRSRTADFVAAGQGLNASVFTNGPFFSYASSTQTGGKEYGWLKYQASSAVFSLATGLHNLTADVRDAIPFGAPTNTPRIPNWAPKAFSDYQADTHLGGTPVGHVISAGQLKCSSRAPNLAYFGRNQGTGFSSYTIGSGRDPTGLSEAIGGILMAIQNYAIDPGERGINSNQYVYWGLAPLAATDLRFNNTGLAAALQAYAKAPKGGTVAGLIFGMFYQNNSHAQLMLDIGVKDAVRLDGSDSTLFGRGQTVLWGEGMVHYKRIAQQYGFAFYPSA